MVSVCVCLGVCPVCVCVCVVSFLLLSFKLSLGCLFRPHHVNQGGVQKITPQVTLYESHTTEESLRRRRSGWFCHFLQINFVFLSLVVELGNVFWTVYGLPRVIFSVWIVTPPSEELKTIFHSQFVLHYTNIVLRLLTCWGVNEDSRGVCYSV
jgi:hypothetical protein